MDATSDPPRVESVGSAGRGFPELAREGCEGCVEILATGGILLDEGYQSLDEPAGRAPWDCGEI